MPGLPAAHRRRPSPVTVAAHGADRGRLRGRYGCGLLGFLVRAKVMTAHTLPPAAIHRHTAVSWGPRTKAKAARVHTVIAELAITTQHSIRITILTRPAPARRSSGAGSRACAGQPLS